MEDVGTHGLWGAAWPGPCHWHLQSERPTEGRDAEEAAPGQVRQWQACCAAQTLHPPSQLLQFSARTPRHEIQPLTRTLHQTGVGKPGLVLPAQELVPGGHLSRFPMLASPSSSDWRPETLGPQDAPDKFPDHLCSLQTPNIGFSSPHGACRQSQFHLPLQQVPKVLLART